MTTNIGATSSIGESRINSETSDCLNTRMTEAVGEMQASVDYQKMAVRILMQQFSDDMYNKTSDIYTEVDIQW